jgi:hypothetical protein
MANNKKTDERVVFRTVSNLVGANSSFGAGTYLWYAYSAQNANYTNIASQPEFNVRKVLYDEFKVSHMVIKYRPYTNQVIISQGVGATAANFNPDIYTFIDRNGGAPVTTSSDVPAKIQQYDSCKIFKWTKSWSRKVALGTFWTSTSQPTMLSTENAAQPWVQKGILGFVGIYAQYLQLPPNTNLGELTVEYHVQFRGKKATAFSYDAVSGSVILTPLSSYTVMAPFNPPQSVEHVLYDETIDISGSAIVVKSVKSGEQAIKDRSAER